MFKGCGSCVNELQPFVFFYTIFYINTQTYQFLLQAVRSRLAEIVFSRKHPMPYYVHTKAFTVLILHTVIRPRVLRFSFRA